MAQRAQACKTRIRGRRGRKICRTHNACTCAAGGSNPIKITGQKGYASTQLFKTKQLSFETLGIGGLDQQVGHTRVHTQFAATFRCVFIFEGGMLSRITSPPRGRDSGLS